MLKNTLYSIMILVFSVLIAIFCMKSCGGKEENYEVKSDTLFSFTTKDTIVYKEKIKYVPQIITVIERDTILQLQYFRYNDTTIRVSTFITLNKLAHRQKGEGDSE
jgi:hypothetical protein